MLAGAFALAWLVGVLVPLAPGGLGLRDGVVVLTAGVTLGLGPATAFAVALRVASLAGELLAVAALEGRCGCSPTRSPPTAPGLHVLHRAGKDGLGVAYRAGFAWCLEREYEVIAQMDCDLSHPPEKLGEMLTVLRDREADLVIGNRYLPGGGTAGWSRGRRAFSRVGCAGSRIVLGLPYDDLSGGFKLWRADCLADLGLESMLSSGYAFQVETTQLAHLSGRRIEEVPFVFCERVAGMSLAVSLEGIRVTLALRRRARHRSHATKRKRSQCDRRRPAAPTRPSRRGGGRGPSARGRPGRSGSA